jgi:hypothetical protein
VTEPPGHPTDPTADIPVYVISFNQPTYLRNMIRQLRALRVQPREIHVVDNASTSPPLLDYLAELELQGHHVHRMPRNLGPHVVFSSEADLALPPMFAVTDPDLQFHPGMPRTFRSDLAEIARWYDTRKSGCALTVRDGEQFLPGPYFQGQTIQEWESSFWKEALPCRQPRAAGPSALGPADGVRSAPVFRAPIDTTFAVYLRSAPPGDFYDAVRVAGPYEARHLPWYARSFESPSAGDAAAGGPVRFDDGRVMVRPHPCEVDHHRRRASGSTTIGLLTFDGPRPYLEVVRPEDGYAFAVAPWTAHVGWWAEHFATGWQAPTFRMLRTHLTSRRGPTRLLDIGSSIGKTALWAALRCEHVYCVEPDGPSLQELRANIAVNRFEHCVTVVPKALSPGQAGTDLPANGGAVSSITIDDLYATIGAPPDEENLFVTCNIGGGEELVLPELLAFAATKPLVVGGLMVAMHGLRCKNPGSLARSVQVAYARHPGLHDWRVLSADLQTLAGPAAIASYLDEAPTGSMLWISPVRASTFGATGISSTSDSRRGHRRRRSPRGDS